MLCYYCVDTFMSVMLLPVTKPSDNNTPGPIEIFNTYNSSYNPKLLRFCKFTDCLARLVACQNVFTKLAHIDCQS